MAKIEKMLEEIKDMLKDTMADFNKHCEDIKRIFGSVKTESKAMKNSQEEIKSSQEEVKDENKQLENTKGDENKQLYYMRTLDEQGKKIDQQNMEKTDQETVKYREKEIDEVEITAQQMKSEVRNGVDDRKQEMGDMRKEISKRMVDVEEEIYNETYTLSKCKALQDHGIVKPKEYHQSSTKLKPPTYDGNTSWQRYTKEFDAATNINNYRTDKEKAETLIVSMQGEVLKVLRMLGENRRQSYKQFVLHLGMRFGDKRVQHARQRIYQAELKGEVTRQNEMLQQYEANIPRLVHLAYPTVLSNVIEQLAVQVFINGNQAAKQASRCYNQS